MNYGEELLSANLVVFNESVDKLEEACKVATSDLERDGIFQRFNYTLNLANICIFGYIIFVGKSPTTYKEAQELNLIKSKLVWEEMTSYPKLDLLTTDSSLASVLLSKIKTSYLEEFRFLRDSLASLLKEEEEQVDDLLKSELFSFLTVRRKYTYWLRKKNTDLLCITLETVGSEVSVSNIDLLVDIKDKRLPVGFALSDNWMLDWLEGRTIPKSRAFVNELIDSLNSLAPRLVAILNVTLGLSLTDDYWVVPEHLVNESWEDHNLYGNEFSETLALVAFTGYRTQVSGIASSPEFTTNGMLRKCWRRDKDGGIHLYKGGTEGSANAGLEPYSEFYAYQVAKVFGIKAVPYHLEKWKGKLCSVCPLFTSKDMSYVPMYIAKPKKSGANLLAEFYDTKFFDHLVDLIFFDAVILNQDRHLGNFGLLRDNETGEYTSCAPAFDHGMSLLHQAMDEDLIGDLSSYFRYRRFTFLELSFEQLKLLTKLRTPKVSEKLRRLLNFKFTRGGSLSLPEKRLRSLEKVVQAQARKLLE